MTTTQTLTLAIAILALLIGIASLTLPLLRIRRIRRARIKAIRAEAEAAGIKRTARRFPPGLVRTPVLEDPDDDAEELPAGLWEDILRVRQDQERRP
jgi:hypothetical protein